MESSYGQSVGMSVTRSVAIHVSCVQRNSKSFRPRVMKLYMNVFVSMCSCAPGVSRLDSFSIDKVIAPDLVKIGTF